MSSSHVVQTPPRHKKANNEDGFMTSLAALRQVLQLDTPTRGLLEKPAAPQVQYFQKEKTLLLKQLEAVKLESKQAILAMQEAANVKDEEHAKELKQLQTELDRVQEESQERIKALELQLSDCQHKVEKLVMEKDAAAECAEEERNALEASMVRLEGINKTLQQRCEKQEAASAKLQTELNERTAAYEQSKVALGKLSKHLVNVESSAAQANEWKLKLNEALSSARDLKYKLQRTERELAASKSKVESLCKEAERQTADWESKIQEEKSKQDEAKKCANLEQELLDKTSALEKQLETETSNLQSKLAAKEALLDAKEKMVKLMTTKIESLQKKEMALRQEMKAVESASIQAAAKHTEEMTALKSDMEEMKDELQCAEDEVVRCREIIKNLEAQVAHSKKEEPAAAVEPVRLSKAAAVVEPASATDQAPDEPTADDATLDGGMPSDTLDVSFADTDHIAHEETPMDIVNVKKRPAQDADAKEEPKAEDSLKEKLLAKKRRSKRNM